MNWNKEKLLFALSLLVFLAVAIKDFSLLGSAGEYSLGELGSPPAGSGRASVVVDLDYFTPEFNLDIRDPFTKSSSWRRPQPDYLPTPVLPSLSRRIPLPVVVSTMPRARLSREDSPPEIEEEGSQ